MSQTLRRRIIGVLFSIAFTILLIEGTLRYIDPLGVYGYFHDTYALQAVSLPHPTGYTYEPGFYDLIEYDVTINDDGYRVVPDTDTEAACTIALLGDSVTFGLGTDDDDTYANLLAQDRPDVHILNGGKVGHSAESIRWMLEDLDQRGDIDGYTWLIVNNDYRAGWQYTPLRGELPNAVGLHYTHVLRPVIENIDTGELQSDYGDLYWDNVEAIVPREDVFAFGWRGDVNDLALETAERYAKVEIIDFYPPEGYVSAYDHHPNAVGHADIYGKIREPLLAFVDSRCAEVG